MTRLLMVGQEAERAKRCHIECPPGVTSRCCGSTRAPRRAPFYQVPPCETDGRLAGDFIAKPLGDWVRRPQLPRWPDFRDGRMAVLQFETTSKVSSAPKLLLRAASSLRPAAQSLLPQSVDRSVLLRLRRAVRGRLSFRRRSFSFLPGLDPCGFDVNGQDQLVDQPQFRRN